MSYRVLIVDNEPWVVVYLKKTFPWGKLGFEVVGDTANSLEALELIRKLKPDVVFTDIRMPELSGLELMQQAKERGAKCAFIIVSGFAEFSYAQEAIRLGAFEYCLKPVSVEQGEILLSRLREHLSDGQNDSLQQAEEAELPSGGSETFEEMLAYIQNHYQEKLKLKDVAQQFYFHPGYCSTLFSKILGMTFPEYLTNLRMKKACSLLKETSLSLGEIAQRVGIDDYFYFNKIFKKSFGVTPNEFRKNLQKREG